MGQFFRVLTYCDSLLLARHEDGVLVNGRCESQALAGVLAYLPSDEAPSCFLIAELEAGIVPSIPPLEPVGRILPLRIARGASRQAVSFYSPWTGLFLVTAEPDTSRGWGPIALAASEVRLSETYRLRPVVDVGARPGTLQATAMLDHVYAKPDIVRATVQLLDDVSPCDALADVLNAVALSLTPQEFDRLANYVVDRPNTLAALQAIYPGDLSASKALPDLARWQNRTLTDAAEVRRETEAGDAGLETVGSEIRIRDVGTEFDQLDRLGLAGTFVSFPHSLNLTRRGSIKPARRACVVATARDEGLYLVDWVAHHRAIGFEEIFVYTNNNSDGSDSLLAALAEANEIIWLRNQVQSGTRPQWKAYNHALRMLPDILDFDWSLFIDLDEYLALEEGLFPSVADYLCWQERRSVDAIALNWAMIGSNGELSWRDAPMHTRFPTGNREPDRHVKCMFRPRKYQAAMPHFPIQFRAEARVIRNSIGELHQYEPAFGPARSLQPNLRYAWIDHFFYKSNEEFLWKFARSRGDEVWPLGETSPGPSIEFIKDFVRLADRNTLQHDPGSPLTQRASNYKTRLLQNPNIQVAHRDVILRYKDRIWSVLARVGSSPAFFKSGEAGRRLLAPLLSL